jgi:hypothetical protein
MKLRTLPYTTSLFVKYIEHFEDDLFVYLITSWMPLGNLGNRMKHSKVGFLTEEEIRGPAKQIAVALEIVHNLGYVHSSVTPENIYIDRRRKASG